MNRIISITLIILMIIVSFVQGKHNIYNVNKQSILLYDDFSKERTDVYYYYSTNTGHYEYENGILKVWDDSQHCGATYVKIKSIESFNPPIFTYIEFKVITLRRGNPSFGFLLQKDGTQYHGTVINLCTDYLIPNVGIYNNGGEWNFNLNYMEFVNEWVIVKMNILPYESEIKMPNFYRKFKTTITKTDNLNFFITGGTCCYGCSCGGCVDSGQSVLGFDWLLITNVKTYITKSFVL